MAKATKERTPEEQAKINERMAKARAARQNKNPKNETAKREVTEQPLSAEEILSINEVGTEPTPPVVPQEDTIAQPDIGDLMRQIQELKDTQWMLMQQTMRNQAGGAPQPQGATVKDGRLTGTVDKYNMNFALYPDPRERLAAEPKLARFAFPLNYELEWEIGESAYETIDKVRMREPKFTLTLIKIMIDDETGDDTGGRYDICRLIMHEDPVAALAIARDNGLEVDAEDETAFLNEMRYIRMRDWLLEAFYPSKPTVTKQKRDMVINGKLVSYWEKNAEVNQDGGVKKVDWDNLPKVRF